MFLIPESTYHIFNRAIGSELLFLDDENYYFFLRKYSEFLNPFVQTLAYCCMPNHFHFLVSIRDDQRIKEYLKQNENKDILEDEIPKIISKRYSNFFSCYTQAFNKVNRRMGGLFIRPFKRKQISDENYLRTLVLYIHQNPVNAGLTERIEQWPFSSYRSLISSTPNPVLDTHEVIDYFGDVKNFRFCHNLL